MFIYRITLAIIIFSLLALGLHPRYRVSKAQSDLGPIEGFTRSESGAERQLEEKFRAVPAADSARAHLKQLTAQPHVAGTKEDYETAVYVRDRLREYGLAADIKAYDVLLPYPKQPSVLELVSPRREKLLLKEPVLAEDSSSADPKIIPLFNGYSASGDVTAPLVYVNYGLPKDYEELEKIGVNVKGKIAIARYGNSFRGVKAKVAEEHGAVGLVIYSDPADDGYAQGDVYPKGPWRPDSSAQRGSVQYLFEYPGDPLTPGEPSIAGVKRIPVDQATNLTRIPVQPISYGDAKKLIEPLTGPLRPKGFQGALPFPYHVGGNDDARVHLKTEMDYQTRPIWNVIARIDGNEERDRWVVLGNHRDAWTFGAVDPNSGSAAMLEVARGFGELLKQGWKPRRTIVLGSWDGEEYGLIGSTEWAEENAAELKQKAVAYLNMDAAVSGPNFGASSVPSLWKLIKAATRDVRDPGGKSVYEQWQERFKQSRSEAELDDDRNPGPQGNEARITALGSGSDYTPFLQHLGIPSLDMSFGGDYGVYHSAYDSFYWMSKFGDPTFVYHVTAAQLWGTIALRLAEAPLLPYDYSDYAAQISDFMNENLRVAKRRNLADGLEEKAATDAIAEFAREAARVEKLRQDLLGKLEQKSSSEKTSAASLRRINDSLILAERALTDQRGLRGRPWYKHQIYAPGYYTGYAALPLPDLRQALDDRNSASAKDGLNRIVQAINRATETLKQAR